MNNDLLGDILSRPPDDRPRYAPPTAKPDARPRRNSGPAIGVIPPGAVERAFIVGLYLACLALVVLSVLGTFYGLLGASAPLRTPLRIIADVRAVPGTLGLALAIQAALTLTQYGARAMARRDRRWCEMAGRSPNCRQTHLAWWSTRWCRPLTAQSSGAWSKTHCSRPKPCELSPR